MPTDTVCLALELEVPLTVVHELVKQHLLASLTPSGTGLAAPNGHHPDPKEASAPVLPSSAGAP